jgi:hypothetical protein
MILEQLRPRQLASKIKVVVVWQGLISELPDETSQFESLVSCFVLLNRKRNPKRGAALL